MRWHAPHWRAGSARRLRSSRRRPRAGASVDEVLEGREEGLRRRELLAGGAGLTAAAVLSGPLSRALAASAPRIVVVGGGLAGLTCAYRLKQAGYRADLHESSDRLGGRCWTLRGAFAEGQIAEHGGELIDQNHTEIRQLAQQLGLNLDNLHSAEVNGTEPFHYFDGQPYSFTQATDDLKQIWQQIHSDVSAASYPTLYTQSTQRGRELDAMSIADWIQAYVPGGSSSKLGQLLDVAYNIEYGAETNVQSSLNMLYLLGFSGQGQLRIFGASNEKYHVRGGNDQIPTRLAEALAGSDNEGIGAGRDRAQLRWQLPARLPLGLRREQHGDRRPRRPGAAVLDPAQRRLLESRLLESQEDLDRTARDGDQLEAPCPVRQTPLELTRQPGRDLRGHRLPEHLGGDPGAAGNRRDPGRLHGRENRGELRQRHPRRTRRQIPLPDRAGPAGDHAALERQGDRSTTGPATPGPRAPTPTGRSASTRSSPAPKPKSRTAATSPASTRRPTSRAT